VSITGAIVTGLIMACLLAVVAGSVIALTWIRGRQRISEIAAAALPTLESTRQIDLLTDENAGLRTNVNRLEERVATLERIVTDPAERTAREIEGLR
jgi:cell division protein FtsB